MYKEDERHNPTNPYSSSKSGAEQICVSYHNTYNIPIIRINVMNAFGERQHIEKFIPKVIKSVLNGDKVFIHSYPDKKTSGQIRGNKGNKWYQSNKAGGYGGGNSQPDNSYTNKSGAEGWEDRSYGNSSENSEFESGRIRRKRGVSNGENLSNDEN